MAIQFENENGGALNGVQLRQIFQAIHDVSEPAFRCEVVLSIPTAEGCTVIDESLSNGPQDIQGKYFDVMPAARPDGEQGLATIFVDQQAAFLRFDGEYRLCADLSDAAKQIPGVRVFSVPGY